MKKIIALIIAIACVLALASCADTYAKGTVCAVRENGDAALDVMPQKVLEKVDVGSTAFVTAGDFRGEMPLVDKLIEEEGKLQLYLDREDWSIRICVFGGSFCEVYGVNVGDKFTIKSVTE